MHKKRKRTHTVTYRMLCACGKNRWEVCAVKKRITVIRSFIIFMLLLLAAPVSAKAEDMQLYAQSAVLMDGDSGRILFGKNEQEVRAMASTTKIQGLWPAPPRL